jgi:alkanesulfonate monooxygenase SsuD/methylene tetrahydromethanopterin reductase-like flavin-dependent oxidoreductase (luciferase family)
VSCGLRDVLSFEADDKPAVLVASSAFADAAVQQAAALGQPEIRCVLVPHPIQDRTDDELRALAHESVEEIMAGLSARRPSQ